MGPLHLRLPTYEPSLTANSSSDAASLSGKSVTHLASDAADTTTHCFQNHSLSHRLTSISELDSPHLSDTMFAHIHGDGALVGTHYEGQVFTTSMQYAQGELQRLKRGDYQLGLSNAERQNISHMSDQLGQSQQTLQQIYEVAKLPVDEREQALQVIQKDILMHVDKLLAGQRLLIPGGWTGVPGHAMLYEIERGSDGTFSFHLYNSGDGLQYHPSRCTDTEPPKTKYLCHLQWNLGQGASAREILEETLPKLLRLRASGKNGSWKTAAEQLYEEVLPGMQKRGASNQLAPRNDPSWSRMQKAGFCTWESIQVWENSRIPPSRMGPFRLCTKVRTFALFTKEHDSASLQKRPIIHALALRSLGRLNKKLARYHPGSEFLTSAAKQELSVDKLSHSSTDSSREFISETYERSSVNHRLKLSEPFIDYGEKQKSEPFTLKTDLLHLKQSTERKRKKPTLLKRIIDAFEGFPGIKKLKNPPPRPRSDLDSNDQADVSNKPKR